MEADNDIKIDIDSYIRFYRDTILNIGNNIRLYGGMYAFIKEFSSLTSNGSILISATENTKIETNLNLILLNQIYITSKKSNAYTGRYSELTSGANIYINGVNYAGLGYELTTKARGEIVIYP